MMKPTATLVENLDLAIAGSTPALTYEDRLLVRSVYRALAAGRPASPGSLGDAVGATINDVESRLARWPAVFRDERGDVIGFWGLALPPMAHHLVFDDGASVHTWCAWDPLFVAPLVGPATVRTSDPVSEEPIRYRITPDGVEAGDVDRHWISWRAPDDRWGEDVITSFCHYVHHFTDADTGKRWTSEHPDTFLIPFDDAVELGRRHAARLRPVPDDPGVPD